jgi:hypothetical protein
MLLDAAKYRKHVRQPALKLVCTLIINTRNAYKYGEQDSARKPL